MKCTVVFRGAFQDGIDHWSNVVMTRDIPLTEDQKAMLKAPDGLAFSELIFEPVEAAPC